MCGSPSSGESIALSVTPRIGNRHGEMAEVLEVYSAELEHRAISQYHEREEHLW
jgi:hypothetical protein